MRRLIVIMGVSGCGKSTVGRALSFRQNWPFLEGDDYHPPENIAKMSARHRLTDGDRTAWVQALLDAINCRDEDTLVLACSALTPFVQNGLRAGAGRDSVFIHLKQTPALMIERLKTRQHFMPASLVNSQFEALHPPTDAIVFDAARPVADLVSAIIAALETGA